MKKILFFLLLLAACTAKGQDKTPTIYGLFVPFDQVDAENKDTVRVFIVFIDTSMKTVSQIVKVGRTYKKVSYNVPVNTVVNYRVGYAVRLKNDAGEMIINNPNMNAYHGYTFAQYMDEMKVPLPARYLVIDAMGLNFKYSWEQ